MNDKIHTKMKKFKRELKNGQWRIGWSDVIWTCQEYHNDNVLQILSRFKVRNIIKDTPVLHLHAGVLEDSMESGCHVDMSGIS